ncbi:MAG: FkbM family methyltransferase [Verrucomicrobia bacterium]|nr:FkbM family methyltransferase [Verrucomicrobiota bacterium]
MLNPGSHIVAFEPLPRMAARIEKMERSPTLDVKVINTACGAQTGTAELYTSSDDDTAASILEQRENARPITVDVVRLDDALSHLEQIFLLKVDTERYELQVLTGAVNTLKKTRYLLLEIQEQAELDAICKHLGDTWQPLRITHSDVLFSRAPGR